MDSSGTQLRRRDLVEHDGHVKRVTAVGDWNISVAYAGRIEIVRADSCRRIS